MKRTAFIILAFFSLGSAAIVAQTAKIGYIDSNGLLAQMPEVKHADSLLQDYANDYQKQYTDYVNTYQQELDDYNKNLASYTEVQKEAKEQDLATLQSRISDFEQSSQDKVEQRKEELYNPILDKVKQAIKDVGAENKFSAVVDEAALLYTGPDLIDITPMVKKKLGLM